MSKVGKNENQGSFWRKLGDRFTALKSSQFIRSFQSVFICGKSTNVIDSSISTGSQITVPWKGKSFQYPEDRYLSNSELRQQLNILELRFVAQTQKLDEYASKQSKRMDMSRSASARNEQYCRIAKMVDVLQADRQVGQ
ncbi:hypothetical protein ACF0H5_011669 [Mactra antiquata]